MPANRATLLALAERCEQAEGANIDLEFELAKLVGLIPEDAKITGPYRFPLPRYTRSIDAAMTLVPACHSVSIDITIYRDDKTGSSNLCSTLALAICAAALRALAETADE